MQFLKRNS